MSTVAFCNLENDEVMKKRTIRESLIHSWCKFKKNMAHLLYMDLFGGDWGDRKKEGIECWTHALFHDPLETLKK